VQEWSARLDRCERKSFRLDEAEVERIVASVPWPVLEDVRFSQAQVRQFAEAQRAAILDIELETFPGVTLGHRNIPIASAGSYVPGGCYPMVASAQMGIVTAKVAGVERVAACTPPLAGELPAATIAAMHLAGADEIYCLGGVHAIAALALGTGTIQPVDFIAGPGNAYVVEAKRQLFGRVGIDLLAGPTEILVVAAHPAPAQYVAADLASQLEHDPMAWALLVTDSEALADAVEEEFSDLLRRLDRAAVVAAAHCCIVLTESLEQAMQVSNDFAPEHLELIVEDPGRLIAQVENAGAVFVGPYAAVSLGDYVIGPNHTLPTAGSARFASPLGVYSFLKRTSVASLTRGDLEMLQEPARALANLEGLTAHANAIEVRMQDER